MQTCTVGFLRVQKLRRPCGHALTYRSENFARFMQIIFRKNLVSISNDSNLSNAHWLIVTSLTKKKKKNTLGLQYFYNQFYIKILLVSK